MVDRVMHRRDRKRRNQRISAGVIGAAIALTVAIAGARELLWGKSPANEPSPVPSANTVDATVTYTGAGCRLDAPGQIERGRLLLRLVNEDPQHEVVFWIQPLGASEQPAELDPQLVSLYLDRWPTARLDPSSTTRWTGRLIPAAGRWAVQCFEDEIPGSTEDDPRYRDVVGPLEVG
jgi:hypothetical protein